MDVSLTGTPITMDSNPPSTASNFIYAEALRRQQAKAIFLEQRACTSCTDQFESKDLTKLDCQHYYCTACLIYMFEAATKDAASYPPKCCKPIPLIKVRQKIDADILNRYLLKEIEYNTENPTYCSNYDCVAFIDTRGVEGSEVTCQSCGCETCVVCSMAKHEGNVCADDLALKATKELMKKENWKECGRCKNGIERTEGCNYMHCTCGFAFCYNCGAHWPGHSTRCSCDTSPLPGLDRFQQLDIAEQRFAAEQPEQMRAIIVRVDAQLLRGGQQLRAAIDAVDAQQQRARLNGGNQFHRHERMLIALQFTEAAQRRGDERFRAAVRRAEVEERREQLRTAMQQLEADRLHAAARWPGNNLEDWTPSEAEQQRVIEQWHARARLEAEQQRARARLEDEQWREIEQQRAAQAIEQSRGSDDQDFANDDEEDNDDYGPIAANRTAGEWQDDGTSPRRIQVRSGNGWATIEVPPPLPISTSTPDLGTEHWKVDTPVDADDWLEGAFEADRLAGL